MHINRIVKCLFLIFSFSMLNTTLCAQTVSVVGGNSTQSLTLLNIDTSGSAFFVLANWKESKKFLIRINTRSLEIDTLIHDLGKYPNYKFYPSAYPYFIKGEVDAKFINQNGKRFNTPFRYHIADYALLNDSLTLFIADVQYEEEDVLAKLSSPLGYYLYNPKTFDLINSDTLKIKAKSRHFEGIQLGVNHWSVIINTGLIFNQVQKRNQRLFGFPIDNDTTGSNSSSNSHSVLIYNNQGKFIKQQFFEGELINSKQQFDIFLTKNPSSEKIQVWKFDEQQLKYKIAYEFESENLSIIDYYLYNDELFLLSIKKHNTGYSISKHNLKTSKVISKGISKYKSIYVNKSGIYLTYDDIIFKPIPHLKKIVSDKKLFNIRESDTSFFRARTTIYSETVINHLDFDFFNNKKEIENVGFKVVFSDSVIFGDVKLIPCYLNNGKIIWTSYTYKKLDEIKFEGYSIKVGNKGYFYFPEKRILWERETAKKHNSIKSFEEAVKKSITLYLQ